MTQTAATAVYGTPANPVTTAISSVAPNPKNLTVQEDQGTGLYGYLNEYGVWVLPPKYLDASRFDTEMGLAVVRVALRR